MKRPYGIGVLVAGLSALWAGPVCAQPVPMHLSTPVPYSATVGAHGRYSKVRINLGVPDLALTTALVEAGGGATAFDARKLLGALTGNGPLTQTELSNLTRKFGSPNIALFFKTFDFALADGLAQATTQGMTLPATPVPDPANAKALATALYAAGVPARGGYDVEYMLDTLLSHVLHVAVMNDIDANPDLGAKADANYHAVLRQTILDLKAAYGLARERTFDAFARRRSRADG